MVFFKFVGTVNLFVSITRLNQLTLKTSFFSVKIKKINIIT